VLPHQYVAKVRTSNFGESATVRLLQQATPVFIPPDLWLSNSPDINPVDYEIWSIIQQRVYQLRVHNIDELKQFFLHVWHDIEQTIIDNAIDEWIVRLRACVRAKGGHFEQLLWQYSAIWQETFQFLSNVTRFLDCSFCGPKLPHNF